MARQVSVSELPAFSSALDAGKSSCTPVSMNDPCSAPPSEPACKRYGARQFQLLRRYERLVLIDHPTKAIQAISNKFERVQPTANRHLVPFPNSHTHRSNASQIATKSTP